MVGNNVPFIPIDRDSPLLLQVPHVNRTDYQLIDISEDGFVSSSIRMFRVSVHWNMLHNS